MGIPCFSKVALRHFAFMQDSPAQTVVQTVQTVLHLQWFNYNFDFMMVKKQYT